MRARFSQLNNRRGLPRVVLLDDESTEATISQCRLARGADARKRSARPRRGTRLVFDSSRCGLGARPVGAVPCDHSSRFFAGAGRWGVRFLPISRGLAAAE
jgi:hypothetical protein